MAICLDVCQYSYDGDCDDGGPGSEYSACNLAEDCFDCGERIPSGGFREPSVSLP